MEFPRAPAPKLDPIKKSLRFQIIDWFIPENDKAKRQIQQEMDWNKPADLYQIYIFGSTEEGHSVCCEVNDFEPYFFVRMPEKWWIGKSDKQMKASVTSFRMELEEAQIESRNGMPRSVIPKRLKDHLVYLKVIKRKDFWGFTNGEDFPFMKVRVKSLAMYNTMKRYFADRIRSDIRKGLTDKETFKLYESNIDPFLRFIHEQNIAPCGWVELPQKQYELLDESLSRAAYNVNVSYKYVKPLEINKIAPLLIASFDIECSSSHGDFPVARKDYRKLAMELIQVARTNPRAITAENMKELIMDAFEKEVPLENNVIIHRIYPKKKILRKDLSKKLDAVIDNIIEELQYVTKTKNASGVTNDDGSEEEDEDAPTRSMSNAVYEKITKDLLVHLGTYIEKKGDNPFSKPEQKWHGALPELEGDQVIQIGTTVHRYGSDEIVYRHIVTLNTCDDIEGSAVEYYDTEEAMLDAWKYFITKLDPDILTGYNIFGFDMKYIWERAKELGMDTEFGTGLGRLSERQTTLLEQRLSSSALGDNFLYYIDMDGVVSIDMLKVMQRDQKLDSYKLDNVSQVFLGDQKDDLKPREIFEKFYGSSADRCVIAKYCLQDCALVNRLLHKLKVLENNVGMGNVCSVPLSYLFMRGQGIKIFSLVAKECRANRYLIPVLRDFNDEQLDDEEGYEGAIVLDPQEGMYLEDPITVLDYASLYPSSMIARNLSHDCYVNDEKYANLEAEGIQYVKVSYDIYEGKGDDKKAVGKKECTFAQLPDNKKGIIPNILNKLLTQRKNTRKKIEYERLTLKDGRVAIGLVKEKPDGTVEILNIDTGEKTIIDTNQIVERQEAYSNFEQAVLDALQLAYKVTANSLYGQIGSRVSPIYLKDIAACTTATGRDMIMRAKKFVETRYGAKVIYGDTDSIFIKFTNRNEKGEIVKGKEALPYAIKAGQLVEKEINSYYEPNGEKYLPEPESLAYEKTLFPFIILSKKRYVGNLYEDDATKKPKQKSMGIVLKRRDNAPIVKKIYGGIIDILLNRHDLNASVEFLRGQLQDLVDGKVPLEELIITKTLRAEYKDPTKIAHKVLADRMGERDEGNKPAANDRVPFIYIQAPDAQLQGDRIEHPEYIREMKLTPDYRFYITNQLMKPICQLYALCIEQLEDYAYSPTYWMEMDKELAEKPMYKDPRKRKNRIEDLRNRCASEILFEPYLIQLGDAPKRKSTPSASKLKEEAKIRRLANISAKPIIHEITLVVTDPKAKAKDYTGTVTYTNITNSTVLWKNVYTFVKKEAQNKLKCQIKMMEQTFDELFNKNMLTKDGAIRIKANKFFAGKWKKALVNIDDLGDQLKKAIETQDYGAFEENAALQLFIRLVSVADQYPYVIETL
jgi:DNA polymerase delta subunit 1